MLVKFNLFNLFFVLFLVKLYSFLLFISGIITSSCLFVFNYLCITALHLKKIYIFSIISQILTGGQRKKKSPHKIFPFFQSEVELAFVLASRLSFPYFCLFSFWWSLAAAVSRSTSVKAWLPSSQTLPHFWLLFSLQEGKTEGLKLHG